MRKPIEQIVAELSKALPDQLVRTLPAKGQPSYIRHQDVKAILNLVCPEWRGEIREVGESAGKVWIKFRLTIPAAGGDVWRESMGHEDAEEPDSLYGDPWSNAEAMAFKRCAAWFGLGLKELYKSALPRPTYADSGKQETRRVDTETGEITEPETKPEPGSQLVVLTGDQVKADAQKTSEPHWSENADNVARVEKIVADKFGVSESLLALGMDGKTWADFETGQAAVAHFKAWAKENVEPAGEELESATA